MNELLEQLKATLKEMGIDVPEEATYTDALTILKKNKKMLKALDKKEEAIKKLDEKIDGEKQTTEGVDKPEGDNPEGTKVVTPDKPEGEEKKETTPPAVPPKKIGEEKKEEEKKVVGGKFTPMY